MRRPAAAIPSAWRQIPPQQQPRRRLVPPISGPVIQPNIPAALQILFNSIVENPGVSWADYDLYTITLFNGVVLRFTTADFDILYNGSLYSSGGVRVDQKSNKVVAHWKVGLDVDTWVVVLMPRPVDPITGVTFPDTIGDMPFIQAAHSGWLSNADFQVDRCYFSPIPTWPMPPTGAVALGARTIFAGTVDEVDCTDLVVILNCNDYRNLLTISMPRNFYQAQCSHTLFDVGCNADGTMVRSSFAVNGSAKAGSTQGQIVSPGLAAPGGSGTYALGRIIMTGGQNAGFSRTVASWDAVNFIMKLVNPFPFTIVAGDTFSASAGCDFQRTTCIKFNNLLNFRGFPFIPNPETGA